MKKTGSLFLCLLVTTAFFGSLSVNLVRKDSAGIFSSLRLPAGFPSEKGFVAIWLFLLTLCGFAAWHILQNPISAKRKKNVLIMLLIFLSTVLAWNFLLFQDGSLTGALAMNVAGILVGLLTTLMAWFVDHDAGYLLFPLVLWDLFSLYLNISLVVLN